MIELAIGPLNRVMALLARGREAAVGRVLCILEVILVTGNARRIRDVVVVVDMAVGA